MIGGGGGRPLISWCFSGNNGWSRKDRENKYTIQQDDHQKESKIIGWAKI
jgi:hypothetical protein